MKGTLDDITFYQSDGQNLVRKKGTLTRERILKDPGFRRTRENMSEFGGAAYVGSQFREGISSLVDKLGDSRVSARVTGIMRKINGAGSGKRGQRSFEMLANKRHLERLEFNRNQSLKSVFRVKYDAPVVDANRSVVTLTLPEFHTLDDLRYPEGATHYQLVLASTVLSDYEYDVNDQHYVALEPDLVAHSGIQFGEVLPLEGTTGGPTELTVDLGLTEALPDTAALVNLLGIQFFQEADGELYLLEGAQALKIISVV